VNKNEQTEEELDELLLVLSKPLTRLVLAILSGIDPGCSQYSVSEQEESS
jgi:hypothetical protein